MLLALALSWSLIDATCNETPDAVDSYVVTMAEVAASGAVEVFDPVAMTTATTWTDSSVGPAPGSVRIYHVLAVDATGDVVGECP